MPSPRLEELSEGVFAYIQPDGGWFLNNTGLVVGSNTAMLVDACGTESRTRELLEAVRGVTRHPVATLVNTHSHADHTHGNCLVDAGTIVAHELCRVEMQAMGVKSPLIDAIFPGVEWGDLELALPTVTFRDRARLHVDPLEVELIHFGPAHTNNDVVAWLPEKGVLFAGDLVFNGGMPNNVAGSIAGTLDALGELGGLRPETIVPGHGDVCGTEVLGRLEAYICFVQQTAREAFETGVGPLDAAREADLGEFEDWLDRERLVGNLHRALSEIEGGPPLDVAAAFRDMMAYNGGPLRCLA